MYYHIVKTRSKKFYVVLVGKNGEPLSTSELLNSKQAAFKNVKAQIASTDNIYSYVQDDTIRTPLVYKIHINGDKELTDDVPVLPRYIPKKNPKKDIGKY